MRPEARFAALLADAYRLGREGKPMPLVGPLVAGLFRDYRLIQLPEEPFRWAVLGYLDGPFVVDSETGADRLLRVTPGASKAPVYIIPGDPQEVEP